ncbi:hypothetical protein [Candidatus Nitrosocosmicus hydrocola]|uniref:hypothetical protein n=1 Tax=Candidatus Nitrosocosmicus hydrocola TaxID=1826872 RepID=UPI001372E141|nr:hypothetical protein [Candidatus Nitrosocosmicus hydrocola]
MNCPEVGWTSKANLGGLEIILFVIFKASLLDPLTPVRMWAGLSEVFVTLSHLKV